MRHAVGATSEPVSSAHDESNGELFIIRHETCKVIRAAGELAWGAQELHKNQSLLGMQLPAAGQSKVPETSTSALLMNAVHLVLRFK
jgi:hypothetical protein